MTMLNNCSLRLQQHARAALRVTHTLLPACGHRHTHTRLVQRTVTSGRALTAMAFRNKKKHYKTKKHFGDHTKLDVSDDQLLSPDGITPWQKPGPKKKVALIVAYNGTAYHGLQLQADSATRPTIESKLLDATWQAGLIHPLNRHDTQKLHFMRAARTDKGVHAVSNLISMELHMPVTDYNKRLEAAAEKKQESDKPVHIQHSDAAEPNKATTAEQSSASSPPKSDTTHAALSAESSISASTHAKGSTTSQHHTATLSAASDKPTQPTTTPASTDAINQHNDLDIAARINKHLPPDVHILGWTNVSQTFHAKGQCTSRVYEYVLPAYVFEDSPLLANPPPPKPVDPEKVNASEIELGLCDADHVPPPHKPLTRDTGKIVTPALRDVINNVLSYLTGSMNFHNLATRNKEQKDKDEEFQQRKRRKNNNANGNNATAEADTANNDSANDDVSSDDEQSATALPPHPATGRSDVPIDQRSAGSYRRYILSFMIGDVFDYNGVEFVRLTVHGQSFMYNQIRKMVAAAVAVIRGIAPLDIMTDTQNGIFSWQRLYVPTAPALGLLLDRTIYRGYDLRIIAASFSHERFNDVYARIAEETDRFKRERLYTQICGTELNTREFATWLKSIPPGSFKPHLTAEQSKERYNQLHSEKVAEAQAVATDPTKATAASPPS